MAERLKNPASDPHEAPTKVVPQETPVDVEDDPERLVGQVLDNRYHILSRIGSGGIGEVYEAEQIQLKRRVAVKVLHSNHAQNTEFRQRFEREALAASKATHPSCVAILDLGTFDERPYLVMEYVEGELLSDHMEQDGLSLDKSVAIGLQVLEALRHAHRHGIVHRDIKPDNVMLCHPDETGTQVKLLDFGLAKNLAPGAPGSKPVTQYGTVCGTPSYMSPEQGIAAEVDPRSDLYSCGVVLYQMLCGRKPFDHDEQVELIKAHLTEQPPGPRAVCPELSPELEAVLLRALEKKRTARFQSAEEFIEALRTVPEADGLNGTGDLAKEISASRRITPKPMDRDRMATAATVHARLGSIEITPAPSKHKPRAHPVIVILVSVMVAISTTVLLARFFPHIQAIQAGRADVSEESNPVAKLLHEGKLEQAERVALEEMKRNKKDGRAHMWLGHVYHRKLWLSDAIKQYDRAVVHAPELRSDPIMLSRAIDCMKKDKVAPKAMRFLVQRAGRAAIPELRAAAKEHSSPLVRRHAAEVMEQIKAGP